MDDPKVIQIFIAYSRKDTDFLGELKTFLFPLEKNQSIKIWYDGEIVPGQVWENEIKQALHSAEIFLLLVSANSLASDYFYNKEVSNALERHQKGESIVIPVILKPCGWRETDLAPLQALPKNGKPVTLWDNKDEAYESIYEGLKSVIKEIRDKKHVKKPGEKEQKTAPPPIDRIPEGSNDRNDILGKDDLKATYKKWLLPALVLLIVIMSFGIYFMSGGTKKENDSASHPDSTTKKIEASLQDTIRPEEVVSKESNSTPDSTEKKAEPKTETKQSAFEFGSFSDAFNFAFVNAKNNFANIRGELLNEKRNDYGTKIRITDKSAEASNIFKRGNEWVFRFTSEGPKDQEPVKFTEYDNLIKTVLKKYNIEYSITTVPLEYQIRTVPYGKGETPMVAYQYRDNTVYTILFQRTISGSYFRYEIFILHSM